MRPNRSRLLFWSAALAFVAAVALMLAPYSVTEATGERNGCGSPPMELVHFSSEPHVRCFESAQRRAGVAAGLGVAAVVLTVLGAVRHRRTEPLRPPDSGGHRAA